MPYIHAGLQYTYNRHNYDDGLRCRIDISLHLECVLRWDANPILDRQMRPHVSQRKVVEELGVVEETSCAAVALRLARFTLSSSTLRSSKPLHHTQHRRLHSFRLVGRLANSLPSMPHFPRLVFSWSLYRLSGAPVDLVPEDSCP